MQAGLRVRHGRIRLQLLSQQVGEERWRIVCSRGDRGAAFGVTLIIIVGASVALIIMYAVVLRADYTLPVKVLRCVSVHCSTRTLR